MKLNSNKWNETKFKFNKLSANPENQTPYKLNSNKSENR